MGYSKISTVEIINFMSFKRAKVSFDESNILNIKGYNDAGKSTILRATAVCLMDMFKSKQIKFIRHGEEYFRVIITFDDGVVILRDKYINGQSLYEVYNGSELVYTSKQGNRLARIEGVPKQVQDYLGLCVTDSVYLNYQSCVDKLPVVDTTGSENYQMFHEVLRMEEIYVANNMINLDKNELGSDIAQIEDELHNDEVLLARCGDVDEEIIKSLEKLDIKAKLSNDKKTKLDSMVKVAENYESIKKIPHINKVSSDRLAKVNKINEIVGVLDSRVVIPSIGRVSSDKLARVRNIEKLVNTLDNRVVLPKINSISTDRVVALKKIESLVNSLNKVIVLPDIPSVDTSLVDKKLKLGVIAKYYTHLREEEIKNKQLEDELENAKSKLKEIAEQAKKMGIELVKCNNCGTYTIAGGGHNHA